MAQSRLRCVRPAEQPDGRPQLSDDRRQRDQCQEDVLEFRVFGRQPGYNFSDEFEFGLDLILDGFERLLAAR